MSTSISRETTTSTASPLLPRGAATWFELPTVDMQRAVHFYEQVLAGHLVDYTHDKFMFVFPCHGGEVTGALVHRQEMLPGDGVLVYLRVQGDLESARNRCSANGGTLLSPSLTVPNVPGTFCVIRVRI